MERWAFQRPFLCGPRCAWPCVGKLGGSRWSTAGPGPGGHFWDMQNRGMEVCVLYLRKTFVRVFEPNLSSRVGTFLWPSSGKASRCGSFSTRGLSSNIFLCLGINISGEGVRPFHAAELTALQQCLSVSSTRGQNPFCWAGVMVLNSYWFP